jgi:nicotinate phosphoribosyltransferase
VRSSSADELSSAGDLPGALVVDLYQLTMAQSYYAEGLHTSPATFSLFVRHLPDGWGYLVAAGLDDVLAFLEGFAFVDAELAYLETTGLFTEDFLAYLGGVRFEGEVRGMLEGTLFFPDEPVLEVRARLLEAQLVETVALQEVHFQSLVAAKAARSVDVARGRTLVDFGLRRTHRAGAGLRVARSSYLAGFDSTSNVEAGRRYGIPIAGTMAHSYVEAFDREIDAFRAFTRSFPDRSILLVDTYDTLEGTRRAALAGRELAESGHRLAGIRLDSGDLGALAREARAILDQADLGDAVVFASGGLDEHDVAGLVGSGAPIDGFGIGSKLGTSADAPYLDMAYKLVEHAGRPTLKLSAAKGTLPGPKQVWRVSLGGSYAYDVVTLAGGPAPPGGEPLLELAMAGGRRLVADSLEAARERCRAGREQLPEEHRRLEADDYEVRIADDLEKLRNRTIAELHARQEL